MGFRQDSLRHSFRISHGFLHCECFKASRDSGTFWDSVQTFLSFFSTIFFLLYSSKFLKRFFAILGDSLGLRNLKVIFFYFVEPFFCRFSNIVYCSFRVFEDSVRLIGNSRRFLAILLDVLKILEDWKHFFQRFLDAFQVSSGFRGDSLEFLGVPNNSFRD